MYEFIEDALSCGNKSEAAGKRTDVISKLVGRIS
jgi:hypothetical protein